MKTERKIKLRMKCWCNRLAILVEKPELIPYETIKEFLQGNPKGKVYKCKCGDFTCTSR